MDSMFLAQLIGLYLLIVGLVAVVRRASLMPSLTDIVKNKTLMILFAFVELAAGLAILLAYPDVTLDWMGVIALVGWMLTIEGILYLALPFKSMQKFVRSFNTPNWYLSGGLLSIVLGAYLAAVGFGMM